jgi:hypothetical protein
MTFQNSRPDPRASVTGPDDAESLVQAALRMLAALAPVIAEETQLLRDGRVKAALELTEIKNTAALAYQRALEDLKANAIAIGRYTPPSLPDLRAQHEAFAQDMALNMAVLGTAKTVSESLMRELAADVAQSHSPQGYGAYGQSAGGYRTPAAPMAVSKIT